jgi:hypothetical protein
MTRSRKLSLVFDESLSGMPSFKWNIEVCIICPKCSSEADIGNLEGGGIGIACTNPKTSVTY